MFRQLVPLGHHAVYRAFILKSVLPYILFQLWQGITLADEIHSEVNTLALKDFERFRHNNYSLFENMLPHEQQRDCTVGNAESAPCGEFGHREVIGRVKRSQVVAVFHNGQFAPESVFTNRFLYCSLWNPHMVADVEKVQNTPHDYIDHPRRFFKGMFQVIAEFTVERCN